MLARPGLQAGPVRSSICIQCSLKTAGPSYSSSRRLFSRPNLKASTTNLLRQTRQPGFRPQYFSGNKEIYRLNAIGDIAARRGQVASVLPFRASTNDSEGTAAKVIRKPGQDERQQPRHQSTQLDRRKAELAEPAPTSPVPKLYPIRPDAPSRLTTLSNALPRTSLRRYLALFLSISKPNLSFLIVLTTAASYALYPVPPLLSATATTYSPTLSALTLVFLTSGTALCCASANALNMLLEPEHDAKMSRTRNRPIVRGLLSKRAALLFAVAAGTLGTAALYNGVNPTVAGLGALNIALYAGVYTPMKRLSVANTWVGAIVGGIPPLMGWAAAAGQAATGDGGPADLLLGEKNAGGWLLAALLFAWQFPHFNALSWGIREEYKAAGYRMLVSFKPRMNARVALRYSVLMFPICIGLSACGVTNPSFVVTSSLVNGWMAKEAVRFWKHEGHKGTARGLFWASVWHLPVIMVLAMAHKKGLWDGVWAKMFGGDDGEEDDDDEWLQEVVADAPYRQDAPARTPVEVATYRT